MAERGAPLGNQNGAKGKRWQNALERALAHQHGSVENGLLEVAKMVVLSASNGDREAWREISDRMDGKAHQSQDLQVKGELTVQAIDYSRAADA